MSAHVLNDLRGWSAWRGLNSSTSGRAETRRVPGTGRWRGGIVNWLACLLQPHGWLASFPFRLLWACARPHDELDSYFDC